MAPLIINENLVSLFKFWLNGQIQEGMGCRNEIFSCLQTADLKKRQQIFDRGWALAEEGMQVVITVSNSRYALWSNLRCLEQAAESLEPSSEPLQPTVWAAC